MGIDFSLPPLHPCPGARTSARCLNYHSFTSHRSPSAPRFCAQALWLLNMLRPRRSGTCHYVFKTAEHRRTIRQKMHLVAFGQRRFVFHFLLLSLFCLFWPLLLASM